MEDHKSQSQMYNPKCQMFQNKPLCLWLNIILKVSIQIADKEKPTRRLFPLSTAPA